MFNSTGYPLKNFSPPTMDHTFLPLFSPIQPDVVPKLGEEKLLDLEKFAVRHRIWQLMYTILKDNAKPYAKQKEVPAFLSQRKTLLLRSAAHSIRQQSVQEKLIRELQNNDIPAVVLKGDSIAQIIYQDANARSSCDIDLLIQETDVEKIDVVLLKANYTRADNVPLLFLQLRLHHTTYFTEKTAVRVPIEVHWNFSIPGFFRLSSSQIWNQTVCDQNGNYSLSAEMTLILLLMHHHRHAFKELRNLIDLFWAFHRFGEEINWATFANQIKEIGLLKTSCLTIHQIDSLWQEHSKHCQGFQSFKSNINRAVGRQFFLNRMATHISSFEEEAFTTKDKIIYRLALDHWDTVFFSFLKSIFPPPPVIQKLFNDDNRRNLPRNYLRYLRWRFLEHSST